MSEQIIYRGVVVGVPIAIRATLHGNQLTLTAERTYPEPEYGRIRPIVECGTTEQLAPRPFLRPRHW